MFKHRTVTSLFAAVTLLGFVPSAQATTAATAIQSVTIVSGTNFATIQVTSGTVSGTRPVCHPASSANDYSIDFSTAKGKAILALAQAALLSSKRVVVIGTGACTNGLEAVSTFSLLRAQDQ